MRLSTSGQQFELRTFLSAITVSKVVSGPQLLTAMEFLDFKEVTNDQTPEFHFNAQITATSLDSEIYVSRKGESEPVFRTRGIQGTSFEVPEELAPGAYTVWVRQFYWDNGQTRWGKGRDFTVIPDVLPGEIEGGPQLLAAMEFLDFKEVTNDQTPEFHFNAQITATSLDSEIYVSRKGESEPVFRTRGIQGTSFEVPEELAPGAYTVWVRQFYWDNGQTRWGKGRDFTVDRQPTWRY